MLIGLILWRILRTWISTD